MADHNYLVSLKNICVTLVHGKAKFSLLIIEVLLYIELLYIECYSSSLNSKDKKFKVRTCTLGPGNCYGGHFAHNNYYNSTFIISTGSFASLKLTMEAGSVSSLPIMHLLYRSIGMLSSNGQGNGTVRLSLLGTSRIN